MGEHYPRIRIHAENGYLRVREGLFLCFYMQRPHDEVKHPVLRSLEVYLRAVGPHALSLYADMEGEWQQLDGAGWEHTRRELLSDSWSIIRLSDAGSLTTEYRFEYWGKRLNDAIRPGGVCAVGFWLPTEFLETHGPGHVRELALELAAPLPLCSGSVGLVFNCELGVLSAVDADHQHRFRYPGLDAFDLEHVSWEIGTRVRGPSWLTFLGQPLLGELGGVAGLRERLRSPDTSVQALEGERAVITLGPWPEAGDTEQGNVLPAYRELARVLEPWLYREERVYRSPEDRRWERRFLD